MLLKIAGLAFTAALAGVTVYPFATPTPWFLEASLLACALTLAYLIGTDK